MFPRAFVVCFCLTACAPATTQTDVVAGDTLTEPMVIADVGFATPESVLYDARADVYLVANINGSPLDKDDNGFISRLAPDGTLAALKWIDGESGEVTLNAPKGMAIVDNALFVADIDAVRVFDAESGQQSGSIEIPGATFLNDVTVGGDGKVYVSDSGMQAGEDGFEPSGSDAVYRIEADNSFAKIAEGADLGRPNGLAADGDELIVVTFGTNELYWLTSAGERREVLEAPKGSLDGVVVLADGRVLFSSWEAKSIFVKKSDNTFETLVTDLEAPADIGYDSKRQRLLIPLFTSDKVVVRPL